ncbi:PAS/PAC sensor hybrid histidine kinase [Calothrix sp. NIES-4071]|nr:PAS/PAC sensor hybrid histidine kinase [Calothrix sp. NIES-4071]BAZ64221.1 PAS/PAC sensor hybrid histidine kinase [Calothrix sp. NIES-4105]
MYLMPTNGGYMPELLHNFFTTNYFIPHGHCYLWKPGLVSLHVTSDMLIGIAYYSIPITLFYFVKKRNDLPFNWIFLLFAAFIIACGTTHFIEIWTLWHPIYWLSGTIKAITAVVSAYTAIVMVCLIPQALALPSPAQLKAANQELLQQIIERQKVEEALRRAHDELEIRVQERTTELETANQALQTEINERKQAESALSENEQLLRTVLENLPVGIWIADKNGQILQANPAGQQIWSGTKYVGINECGEYKGWWESTGKQIQIEEWALFKAIMRGETSINEVIKIQCFDGSYKTILNSALPIWDAKQNIHGAIVVNQDITNIKRTEEELRRQNLRSQLFAEVTLKIRTSLQIEEILQNTVTEVQRILQADRVLIFKLNSDGSGRVVQESVVPGWQVTLGLDIFDPCFERTYLQKYRQGQITAITNVEDGSIRPCYVEFLQQFGVKANLVVPIFVRENLWGLLIAHQCEAPRQWTEFELTLLKHLADQIGIALSQAQLLEQEVVQRQELMYSQQELRAMSAALESAVEGISQLDTSSRYIKVNPAYATMLGYQPEELIGMKWQQTLYPEDQEKLIAAYHQMLTNGKAEIEARAVRKDGSVFDKQVVMVKAHNPQQEFIGHYCFMKDISDRREVERLKDEFVSIVSHELRTPLTSISGALDLLASGILQTQPEERARMLNIAANNTDRLVRLINDILDIERIESGKIQMTKQICNAADLMTQSVEVVEEMALQAELILSVSPISANIWADSDRIIQVFTNLLSNAIKFSSRGATVWLSAEIQEDKVNRSPSPYILFKVQDQGRGIPADKIESIFERFQQVDASDSRQKGGTGLGLAICRSILQHHGGSIWAESTLGVGSTFFFTLPMLSEPHNDVDFEELGAPLILQCDDDPDVRAVVQTMLQRQGYRVLTAASGLEAVEMAVQQHPAVIILNLMMPGMDGWETLAVLKQRTDTQNIPIIILSGLFPDINQGLPTGVSDWIVKPPNLRLLCQALEKALAKNNQSIKVLIIEDDQDLAQVLITMFNRHGIETYYAPTGLQALQASQQIIPDLLVLDLGLPEYDGFAVVDWLRQHNSLCHVPLVVYTAQDLNESDRQRLKLGQTIYLTKGRISPIEFEQRVITLLNRIIRGSITHNS